MYKTQFSFDKSLSVTSIFYKFIQNSSKYGRYTSTRIPASCNIINLAQNIDDLSSINIHTNVRIERTQIRSISFYKYAILDKSRRRNGRRLSNMIIR